MRVHIAPAFWACCSSKSFPTQGMWRDKFGFTQMVVGETDLMENLVVRETAAGSRARALPEPAGDVDSRRRSAGLHDHLTAGARVAAAVLRPPRNFCPLTVQLSCNSGHDAAAVEPKDGEKT